MTQPECNEDTWLLNRTFHIVIPRDWHKWSPSRKLAYVERFRTNLIGALEPHQHSPTPESTPRGADGEGDTAA